MEKIKWVKASTDKEIEMLWKIYQSNTDYFLMTSEEKVERLTLEYNLRDLPPNCRAEQKEFLLIYYDG